MSAPVEIGDVVDGKYRIDGVLGAGGMGVVLRATHLGLDRKVAIKFLLAEALARPDIVARFAREARAAAKIMSEHVARVLDVGALASGAPYLVMEYLEGEDLERVLASRGRLGVDEAAGYVLEACEAVAEAHAAGIVHRDLKPANLFLAGRADGSKAVKVLDFGMSKVASAGAASFALTTAKTVLGSPLYMAPEQMENAKGVDARADIWALGVILFEATTGAAPFTGETLVELTRAILLEPAPSLSALHPSIPPAFEAVVRRCLEKERAKRFEHVAELAGALQPFARGRAASVARISRVLGIAAPTRLEPGSTFGRYRIGDALGEGGMGVVYGAHDTVLRREVALKVLSTAASERDPAEARARLLREARAAAALVHPSAVSIFDVGEADGMPFIAMELVAGRSLRACLEDGAASREARLRWLVSLAEVLGAAHAIGLVHRDVKPENVVVRDDGSIKVLDFGIAKRATSFEEETALELGDTLAPSFHTVAGRVLGTPRYMAPEQKTGGEIDGRTDQYAWGLVACECLSGGHPQKQDLGVLLRRARDSGAPPIVLETILRALSGRPADRFASMEEIAARLRPLAASVGPGAARGSAPPPHGATDASLDATQALDADPADGALDVTLAAGDAALGLATPSLAPAPAVSAPPLAGTQPSWSATASSRVDPAPARRLVRVRVVAGAAALVVIGLAVVAIPRIFASAPAPAAPSETAATTGPPIVTASVLANPSAPTPSASASTPSASAVPPPPSAAPPAARSVATAAIAVSTVHRTPATPSAAPSLATPAAPASATPASHLDMQPK